MRRVSTLIALLSLVHLAVPAAAETPATRSAAPVEEHAAELAEAKRLNEAGEASYKAGDRDRAATHFEAALRIRERVYGASGHLDLAESLANVAQVATDKRELPRAEALFTRALTMAERFAPGSRDVAQIAANFGTLYLAKGDNSARAESLFTRALQIREALHGTQPHREVVLSLYTLARVYSGKGDHARAESLYVRALQMAERLDPESREVAQIANSLGLLHLAQGDDDAIIEGLLQRSLRIREKLFGPDHPEVAESLASLGGFALENDNFAAAHSRFERALRIFERAYGPDSPSAAAVVNNLAGVCMKLGDLRCAEPLLQRALRTNERVYGVDHPEVALVLRNLSSVAEGRGDLPEALRYWSRAGDIREREIDEIFAASAEAQKAAFFDLLTDETEDAVSLHVRRAPANPDAARFALTMLLRRKGRVLDASGALLDALRKSADRSSFEDLRRARSELAAASLRGPQPGQDVEQHRARLAALVERGRKVEEASARRRASAKSPPVMLESVQATLKAGQALVELDVFTPTEAQVKGEGIMPAWTPVGRPRYVAYVLGATGAPRHVDLGLVSDIDGLAVTLRDELGRKSPGYADVARRLDAVVMAKVRPLLGGARDILLSPDGQLGMVPFGALIDEDGRFLTEQLRFTYLSSGRDPLRWSSRAVPRQPPLIVASPEYGPTASPSGPARGRGGEAAFDFAKVRFPALAATEGEARAIAKLWPGASVKLHRDATERVLREARGPAILHVATHGYFLEDRPRADGKAKDRRALVLDPGTGAPPEPQVALSEDPLLRAGLALAGANVRADGDDDGVLTALEAMTLDLTGTRLVTLSACETGVGSAKNGDGLFGLRRSLVLAGAESQLLSLWKVDDEVTATLMKNYYGRLANGGARSDALREVQLALLASPATAHPYYWAAFVVSGDPRTLDGGEPPEVRAGAARAPSGQARQAAQAGQLPARGCGGCRSTESGEHGAGSLIVALGGAWLVRRRRDRTLRRRGQAP